MKKNDVITNVVPKLDGWWEGHLNGKIGMFPDNFVKIIEKPANPVTPPEPVLPALQKPSSQSNVILRSNSNKTSRYKKSKSYTNKTFGISWSSNIKRPD